MGSGVYIDADGHVIPWVEVWWTDSTSEDVQGHEVELQVYIAGEWVEPTIHAGENEKCRISPVAGNVAWRARVRAFDDAGLRSAWTDYVSGTTAKDNVAPATPEGLAVTAVLKGIRITVDEPSEPDYAGTEFHVSQSSGFTPGAGTLKASGRFTSYTYETTSYAVHYVKLRHYDSSKNYSGYCAQVGARPDRLNPPADIPDSSIPGSKIPDNQISDSKITGISAGKITGEIVNAQVAWLSWAKIKYAAIESADIVSLVASKITAGTIAATISITTMGRLTFASSGGTYLQGATTFLKCFGHFGTGSPYDISAGSILLDSSANTIFCGTLSGNILKNVEIDGNTVTGDGVMCGGLNAEFLCNYRASIAATANKCAVRDGTGDINVHDVNKSGACGATEETSKGEVKLISIESPEVWYIDFQEVGQAVDPLFLEVTEGQLLSTLVYPAGDDGMPDAEGKATMMLIRRRRGYTDKRFEQAQEEVQDGQDYGGGGGRYERGIGAWGPTICLHDGDVSEG